MIQPKILKGTRDFLPADMAKRNFVMDKIKSTFINFGYDTIETPVIEYAETLTGKYGEEGNKLMYRFQDNGGRDIALRYDQTVPFSRVIATHHQSLPMPFKRYQISRVWRADRPGKGRYREFYQCDIDIIGTQNLVAEAEVAKVTYEVFKRLGFKAFIIKYNSRRVLNTILENLGVPSENKVDVIRTIDKLDKIGKDGVTKELKQWVEPNTIKMLLELITFSGSFEEKVARLKDCDTSEIETFQKLCQSMQIPEENLKFELSLARGLDYYTGINYEVDLPNVDIGSVAGGGRYDDLCSKFTKEKLSGVGIAFGFDRIVTAMEELEMLNDIGVNSKVLVTNFDESSLNESISILNELQTAGINAEIYFQPDKMGKQMKYANKKGIPLVVICGPEEVEKKVVKVKVMESGEEEEVRRESLVEFMKNIS